MFARSLISLVAIMILGGCSGPQPSAPPKSIAIYAAASLRTPLEKAIKAYRMEHAEIELSLDLGASQAQLTKLDLNRSGDLYIPADASYITLADEKKLVSSQRTIGRMHPVLVMNKGKRGTIASFDELLASEMKIAQADPAAAAIGKVTQATLEPLGKWERLRERTAVFKGNVTEAANDLKLGAADAAIIWNAMLGNYPEFETIAVPEFETAYADVIVAVTTCAKHRTEAEKFADYLASPSGFAHFREAGFEAVVPTTR